MLKAAKQNDFNRVVSNHPARVLLQKFSSRQKLKVQSVINLAVTAINRSRIMF
jgi:hypothetical protein